MYKKTRNLLSWTLVTFTFFEMSMIMSSCTINPLVTNTQTSDKNKRVVPVTGTVQFSEQSALLQNNTPLTVKASLSDVTTSATVSLLFPPDHPSTPNKTIATGLTDSGGQFSINPDSGFVPETGSVYILEAAKRVGSAGSDNMALRTFVKWNGNTWESITAPGIYINTYTTAVMVISSLNPGALSPLESINRLIVMGGVTQVKDINTDVTAGVINNVKDLVTFVLGKNRDPVGYIKYSGGIYSINNPSPVGLNIVTTVAGSGNNIGIPGLATLAGIGEPRSIAVDSLGNIYIADTYRGAIRKVDSITGIITTFAGNGNWWRSSGDGELATSASFSPSQILFDSSENLYIADANNHRIRKIDAVTNIISTVAGNGIESYSGDGGLATSAILDSPSGISIDNSGNIYINDYGNYRIRKIDTVTNIISTVAGNGINSYSGDGGPATSASLNSPSVISVDTSGNIYISDGYYGVVRKVDVITKNISRFAGNFTSSSSGDGGDAKSAGFRGISGITADSADNIYISESGANKIRKIDGITKIVNSVVGDGYIDSLGWSSGRFSGDGGPATSASLDSPGKVVFDNAGNMYIPDYYNNRVRKVSYVNNNINTVAGNGFYYYSGDGDSATSAGFNSKRVALDKSGNIYINDQHRIRKVNVITGIITTVAGNGKMGHSGDGGPATSARINSTDIAVDSNGNIYLGDNGSYNVVRKIDSSTGIITTFAGNRSWGSSGDGGLATSSSLQTPYRLALDKNDNLFIANDQIIRKVDAVTNIISTVAGNGIEGFSGDGGPATSAGFNGIIDIALDKSGNLYISDSSNNGRIRKVDSVTKIITTIAGNGIPGYSGDGGPATSANLYNPYALAIDDTTGNIIIADVSPEGGAIRKINLTTGIITTIAGNKAMGFLYSGDGVPATSAVFESPYGIEVDSIGNIFIADGYRIRKINMND